MDPEQMKLWLKVREKSSAMSPPEPPKRVRKEPVKYLAYGHLQTLSELSKVHRIPFETLKKRIQRGWTVERAIKTPVRPYVKGGNDANG